MVNILVMSCASHITLLMSAADHSFLFYKSYEMTIRANVIEFLALLWNSWIVFLASGFGPAILGLGRIAENEPVVNLSLSLSIYLSLSASASLSLPHILPPDFCFSNKYF